MIITNPRALAKLKKFGVFQDQDGAIIAWNPRWNLYEVDGETKVINPQRLEALHYPLTDLEPRTPRDGDTIATELDLYHYDTDFIAITATGQYGYVKTSLTEYGPKLLTFTGYQGRRAEAAEFPLTVLHVVREGEHA